MKKLFILLAIVTSQLLTAQLERIDPPFWWSDMRLPELQLMVYGHNIARYTPEIEGVIIKRVVRPENPNYLFITLDTKRITPGKIDIVFKSERKTAFTHTYTFKERRPGSAQRKGFDASDVIYLLMPDRFANGDPANDSHPSVTEKADRSLQGGRHGGDIQGIIEHLDYIKEVGATAIWSTPMLEDNDPAYSYHTYAQSDVYRIDPRFGTNEDYKKLADELHKRDMKLIMDYVTNHWGSEHWMIKDLPMYDWIHQFPGYENTNHRMTAQFDPNASHADFTQCMNGWFVKTMPDLDQSNPFVLTYLIQNAIWWIEYADLDGFRVDTYSYNDKEGIARWTKAITDEYPNINIVGEVWLHNQAQIAYWQKNSEIAAIQSYNTHLPSVMDFTLHDAIMEAFQEDEQHWNKGMVRVYDNLVNDFLYPNINNLLVFAENHDTKRINEIYPDIRDYKLVMTLIATIRGIPQLYYGSEIGMKGDKEKGDGDIRRDFPGGWPGDKNNAFSARGRTSKQQEYFQFTSLLFNWRQEQKAVHFGKTRHFAPQNNVYTYFRYTEDEAVMVLINNHPENQKVTMSSFEEITGKFSAGWEVFTKKDINIRSVLEIPGKTAMIIELK
ncbi:glycoside hydrolase family 13 protein [Ascidiimonas aurantiaca]|uniref:glycoside hydrolase family 13 protein n=1 Tax=Ascidiimonas aurantiaca TaxID=1685432 RepID=UPI0030EB399C